jgi:hypothetical protein
LFLISYFWSQTQDWTDRIQGTNLPKSKVQKIKIKNKLEPYNYIMPALMISFSPTEKKFQLIDEVTEHIIGQEP